MSQRYLVTARKYRPARFNELVAQEHVTETLKNALRMDRLAHAYLFSGPRGVGKTTAARILAKAINCTTPLEERDDNAEPCRTCDSCRDFEEGRSLNIFEIDAASNNKVDDIRELRETVRVPPQGARKKVYIIDEVHMLSTAAFNALLKTLEEPPPHVLFIFATTEPHKVLPTILSRCQRFDFRRIPVPEIVARLEEICTEESITADEDALMLIARKGDGALRDALSAFDQAVSLCGTDLKYVELAQALRVVDIDLFFEVTQQVTQRSAAGMLRLVDRTVRAGYDLHEFLAGLAEHLRNLLVAHTMEDTTLIEAAEATRHRYTQAAAHFAESDLMRLLMIVDEAEETIKGSTQPRMKLEMALLKMSSLAHSTDLRAALQAIDRLEKMARDGEMPAALPPVIAPPVTQAPVVASEPVKSYQPVPEVPTLTVSEPTPPQEKIPPSIEEPPPPTDEDAGIPVDDYDLPPRNEEEMSAPPVQDEEVPSSNVETHRGASLQNDLPAAAPEPTVTPPAAMPDLFGPPALTKKTPRNTAPPTDDTPSSLFAGDTVTVAPESATLVTASPALQRVLAVWDGFVKVIKDDRIHVGALLQHTTPIDITAEAIVIGVPDDFHRRLLGNQHDFLLKHLQQATQDQEQSRLLFTVREDVHTDPDAAATTEADPREYMARKREEDPVLQAIFEQFGGELG